MIARIWRGWTAVDTADEYAAHLRDTVLPELASMPGNLGSFVVRRRSADGIEFMTLSVWDSPAAVGLDERVDCAPEDHPLLVGRQSIPAQWEVLALADVPLARAA